METYISVLLGWLSDLAEMLQEPPPISVRSIKAASEICGRGWINNADEKQGGKGLSLQQQLGGWDCPPHTHTHTKNHYIPWAHCAAGLLP